MGRVVRRVVERNIFPIMHGSVVVYRDQSRMFNTHCLVHNSRCTIYSAKFPVHHAVSLYRSIQYTMCNVYLTYSMCYILQWSYHSIFCLLLVCSVSSVTGFSVWYSVNSVQCTVFSVQCPVYSVQCTAFSALCSVFSVQFPVFQASVSSTQQTVFNALCSVHSDQCLMSSVQ